MDRDTLPQDGRPRRWRVLALAAAAGLLLYALLGFFLVPRVIRAKIVDGARESLKRDAQIRDVRFNPFTLAATIDGLRLADRDGQDLVTVDRIYANADTFGIFRWALRFSEITIDRPVVNVRILASGKPSIADLMEADAAAEPDEPFELPRLIIDRLLMTAGQVQFTDASRQPAYASRFEPLTLDITDLITIPQEGGEHAVTIGVGEGAELRWTGRQTVEPLQFTGRLDITGIDLHRVWDYVAPEHALDIREGRATLALPYEIRRGVSAPFEASLKDASAQVTGLAVRPRDGQTDWLTLPDMRAERVNVAWPAASATVARIAVDRPRLLTRVEDDGRTNWQQVWTSPPEASPSSTAWAYDVAAVDVTGGAVRLEHSLGGDAPAVELEDVAVHLKSITSKGTMPIAVASTARVQSGGTLEASGTAVRSPVAFDLAVAAHGVALAPWQPYLPVPGGTRIGGGTASIKGQATMTAAAQALTLAGGGSLDDIELRDLSGERLAAWKHMTVDGFTLDVSRARIRTITLAEPYAKVLIDRQGNLNLTRLAGNTSGTPAASSPASTTAASGASNPAPTLEIGRVVIQNASADFSDESLPLSPFSARIHSANGSVRDLSSFAAAPATMDIEGRVDRTGFVKIGGTLRTSDPMAASEITVGFRSIDMPALTPYFAEFAGYRVRSGNLDLDVRYQVQSRRLVGNHSIVAHNLVLGDRVKDSKGPGFAVRLAVALLKDRQGRINLDVPIEGTVDSPEFGYRTVFWGAVRTILGNAAKAPFRAIGRLFGRDEDDLELVEFDAGRSDLLPAEREMLVRVAEQLAGRGELSLAVEGRFDPKADPPALRRAKLEAMIEARRAAATAAAVPGSSALETILEGLFTDQFGAEAVQAERLRFTRSATAPAPPSAAPAAPAAPAPAPAVPAAPAAGVAFDAAAFYESLRQRLLDAQTITDEDLRALATARAGTIVATLTSAGGLDAARITRSDPGVVKRSKANSQRIASEMEMSAGEEDEGE